MKTTFLKANHLCKNFGGVKALIDIDFHIDEGETLCMIGENGSGKSTLVKVISGIYAPDSGNIVIQGNEFSRLTPMESLQAGIQVIYQDFSLFPNLTVAENIATNYFLSERKKLFHAKKSMEIAREALAAIDIDIDIQAEVAQLSVAQKQLTAIARALLQNAKLIIMDEPTTALTAREVEKLFRVIQMMKERGCAILFVSHKLDEVKHVSERIIVLRGGEKTADIAADNVDTEQMTYYISGKHFDKKQYEYIPDKDVGQPVLKVNGLSYQHVFSDISFQLNKGEILGITGLLGSGRTELALALFGMIQPDKGDIFIKGEKKDIRSVRDALKNSIGYVPEDRLSEGLFLEESIKKNVIIRNINESNQLFLNKTELQKKAEALIRKLKIKAENEEVTVNTLSGGNQQRVVLAKWLSILPDLLILNGPTVGVDIGSKSEILEIIRELGKNGMSIIVISDDMNELMQSCNRICVMKKGKINHIFAVRETDEESISKLLMD